MKTSDLKRKISLVFVDKPNVEGNKRIFDRFIIGLILLSTIEIFLSTYESVTEKFGNLLLIVDYITTIAFTIEVTLRIWTADLLDEKYKGFWGRVRYCFSFYGLIDFISTYPFYINLIIPVPYTVLKALRIARLLRIFRYVKAFSVLSRALQSKKDEMIVSIQFLVIITVILSLVLYFVENEAQPDVYDNGWTSVVWAFAQYIGDPGGFADTPPITYVGRMIAVIIGILGIAIFAVPAGLVGSAFSEIMEEDEEENNKKEWHGELIKVFQRKLDRVSGYQIAPKYVTFIDIQAFLGFKEEQIFEAVKDSKDFRVINLSKMVPLGEYSMDQLALENFQRNTSYGCMINRHSKVTIVSASSLIDPVIGHFAYYLAKLGGFNFISREFGERRPYVSYIVDKGENNAEGRDLFMNDLKTLCDTTGGWCFTILAASGSQEPSFDEEFHFEYGRKKGDDDLIGPDCFIKDVPTFMRVYDDFSAIAEKRYGLKCERQKYHNVSNPKHFARLVIPHVNTCILRIAWSVTCWNPNNIAIARDLANVINKDVCNIDNHEITKEMTVKDLGFTDYKE